MIIYGTQSINAFSVYSVFCVYKRVSRMSPLIHMLKEGLVSMMLLGDGTNFRRWDILRRIHDPRSILLTAYQNPDTSPSFFASCEENSFCCESYHGLYCCHRPRKNKNKNK